VGKFPEMAHVYFVLIFVDRSHHEGGYGLVDGAGTSDNVTYSCQQDIIIEAYSRCIRLRMSGVST
jgi:hypothetical protein